MRIGSIETNTPSGMKASVNQYTPVTIPSSPIATRKTPVIFMITINRPARGRFLIVWISCLYVIRGALRAFTVTGGEALSVIRRPPRRGSLPPSLPPLAPRTVPRIPLPSSVLASEEVSAQVPPLSVGWPRASSQEPARRVSEPGPLRRPSALWPSDARAGGPGRGGAPARDAPTPHHHTPNPGSLTTRSQH